METVYRVVVYREVQPKLHVYSHTYGDQRVTITDRFSLYYLMNNLGLIFRRQNYKTTPSYWRRASLE